MFRKLIIDQCGDCSTLNPLSIYPTKWSNTLKQFASNLPTNCLSVFDHFMKLTLKGLNDSSISKLVTRKLIEVNDFSNRKYYTNKNKRFKTAMLRSDLCECSEAYIIQCVKSVKIRSFF